MLLSDVCLSDVRVTSVCLTSVAYIGRKSRTKRPSKIGTEVAHVTRDLDNTFRVKRSRSPGRFGWLFKSLHNLYGRRDHSLPIMNIYGARRAGRRRRKACRLWTGGGPQARSVRTSGAAGTLCRHAHSWLELDLGAMAEDTKPRLVVDWHPDPADWREAFRVKLYLLFWINGVRVA